MRQLKMNLAMISLACCLSLSAPAMGQSNHAFRWDPTNGMTFLENPAGWSYDAGATAINTGEITVGAVSSAPPYSQRQAVVWDAMGKATLLGNMGYQNSAASAINDSDQVVGAANKWVTDHWVSVPFLWDRQNGMKALSTLGSYYAYPKAINNNGQIVGFYNTANDVSHACLWSPDGQIQDLGTLTGSGSVATAINDVGQVVGYYSPAPDGTRHAFLWDSINGMRDLGITAGAGWSSFAEDINMRDK